MRFPVWSILMLSLEVARVLAQGPAAPPLPPPFFEAAAPAPGFFPRIDPEAAGLSREVLGSLTRGAEEHLSDGLIVLRGGHTVVERSFGSAEGPINLFSVTKGISSLAIGMLIAEGRIPSVDVPMSTWIPEWKEGPKSRILLRHVLTHTTGIKSNYGGAGFDDHDSLAYVTALPLVDEPGKVLRYSNEGSHLMSLVVLRTTGMQLDRYLDERLFRPLGITDWHWGGDDKGVPMAFSALHLRPRDLARIGAVLASGGRLGNRQIVPADWLEVSTHPVLQEARAIGYIWWPRHTGNWMMQTAQGLERLRAFGFPRVDLLASLTGQPFGGEQYYQAVYKLLGDELWPDFNRAMDAHVRTFDLMLGRWIGFGHDGSGGQALLVYPPTGLVAVRMRRFVPDESQEESAQHGFRSLTPLCDRLAVGATSPGTRTPP